MNPEERSAADEARDLRDEIAELERTNQDLLQYLKGSNRPSSLWWKLAIGFALIVASSAFAFGGSAFNLARGLDNGEVLLRADLKAISEKLNDWRDEGRRRDRLMDGRIRDLEKARSRDP